MINLLNLALTTTSDSPQNPSTPPPPSSQNMDNLPVSSNGHSNPYSYELNIDNPEQAGFSSYIAPWSQPQAQSRTQPQQQTLTQPHYHQNPYGYPPPPWASSSSSFSNQHPLPMSPNSFGFADGAGPVTHTSVEATGRPPPDFNPPTVNNRQSFSTVPASAPPSMGQRPYVPSYWLFKELNVLPSGDSGQRMGNGRSSLSLSGVSGQSRVGGGGEKGQSLYSP